MTGYNMLAPVYDRLNETVDYAAWADFLEACFRRYGKKPASVLDLACGTGNMTLELARRGYDMTALDLSDDMLAEADRKARTEGLKNILLLSGDMAEFELYGTVEAVVCCLDGINHLLRREDLDACFALVANYLEPGGLFCFDVNTPHKFRTVYADRDYILEDTDVMCCWRNRLSRDGSRAEFYLTVFEEKGGGWTRRDGYEEERAWGMQALKNALGRAGLEFVGVSADYAFTAPGPETERWHIAARKPGKKD